MGRSTHIFSYSIGLRQPKNNPIRRLLRLRQSASPQRLERAEARADPNSDERLRSCESQPDRLPHDEVGPLLDLFVDETDIFRHDSEHGEQEPEH